MEHTEQMISVVICAYTEKRWADLLAAIESVQRQSIAPLEVNVVVDHNPALLERVRNSIPGVVAVPNTGQRGLGGARNSGISSAQGSIIAFLDDDAIATPDWLKYLRRGYRNPDVLGVGGSIEPLWQGGRPRWFPQEFDWVVGCSYRGLADTASPVRNLIGCNMSFRREVFATAGTFHLGYGCDETEFCIRVHRCWPQKLLLYEPQAKVYHRVPAERGSWRYFFSRCLFEGRSKAVVAWLQGSRQGLASERAYTFKTLPLGVMRSLLDSIRNRNSSGIQKSAAIVSGLAVTTYGYLHGKLATQEAARERGWTPEVLS